MNKVERNGTIDFWRFMFSLLIVCSHFVLLPSAFDGTLIWFKGATIAVEFFFIVSGFLMAKSAGKYNETPTGKATAKYISRKYISILPTYLFAYIVSFFIKAWIYEIDHSTLFAGSFFELFFLQNAGLTGFFETNTVIVSASWYLSAMMITMLILFPLLHSKKDLFLNVLAPIICIFIFFHFATNEGTIKFESGLNSILRASLLLCLGCVCHQICEKIKNLSVTMLLRIILTIVENIGYISIFLLAWAYRRGEWDFIAVIILAVSITISFSGLSLSCYIFKGAFFQWLGKFSLAIYLNHHIWITLLGHLNMPLPIWHEYLLLIALSLSTSLVCVFITDIIKELWSEHGSKVKKLFIKENA